MSTTMRVHAARNRSSSDLCEARWITRTRTTVYTLHESVRDMRVPAQSETEINDIIDF